MEIYNTVAELAKLLRLTSRRVNQLVKENVLKKEANGKFNTCDAIEAFYAFKFKTDEELNYDIEHTLLEKAKREKAEIELEQLKGSLLYAVDVEQLMANMIITYKSRTLSMPAKCATKVIGQTSLSVITEIIKTEVNELLNELKQIPFEKLGEDNAIDT